MKGFAMLDKKQRFVNLVEDRVGLANDLREGLRDSILANQPLKALVHVEMILDRIESKLADLEPKGTVETPAPVVEEEKPEPKAKTASSRKTTKATDEKDKEVESE